MMRLFLVILLALVFNFNASAQYYRLEKATTEVVKSSSYTEYYKTFYLSSNVRFWIFYDKNKKPVTKSPLSRYANSLETDAKDKRDFFGFYRIYKPSNVNVPCKNYAPGTLFYLDDNIFEVVEKRKVGVYTIARVATRNVSAQLAAQLNGNITFGSFGALFRGIGLGAGAGSGSIQGSAAGGTETIVNVVFTNRKAVSIKASDNPLWLEAKPGMKVIQYKMRHLDVYEVVF